MDFSTCRTSFDSTDSGYETEPELLETPVIECAESHTPDHVVLALWPHAQPEQIQYYVQGYPTLYPNSTIHLLHHNQTSSIDAVLNNLLGSSEKAKISERQNALVHVFGNSSARNICTLLKAYQLRTAQSLPVKSLILDSVPITITPTLRSIWSNPALLLNLLLAPFLHIRATLILWFSEPFSEDVRRDLDGLCGKSRRKWIFPGRDVMYVRSAVECEDEESRNFTFDEKYPRQARPMKWSVGQERYWAGIEKAWEY